MSKSSCEEIPGQSMTIQEGLHITLCGKSSESLVKSREMDI